MTSNELKKKVAKAANLAWHTDVEETFNFPYVNFVLTLKGVSSIYEFVTQQINGWQKIEDPLPDELSLSKTYFENIKNHIINFVDGYSQTSDINLQHYWSSVSVEINSVHNFPVPYHIPETKFLISLYNKSSIYYLGAYNVLVASNFSINSKDLFFGAILGYEFKLKDATELTNRRKAEQKGLTNLKIDFQAYMGSNESALINHLNDANELYKKYAEQIDEIKKEKEQLFSEWFETTKTNKWQKWYDEKITKLEKLEETYETKLKLEKPAKYWQIKSATYYKQGQDAKTILIRTIGATATFLALILIISPKWIFMNVFNGNSTAIVRWSIVFITLVTLIAYAIKALTKYMFSSFHLARDAEERHTLTFFYLALLKDTQVNDDDRKLILQSLFSRVETGLLKDDSSPTMPNDAISKIIGR
jgi:hypothetical protein